MKKKEIYQFVLQYFRDNHAVAETELNYSNPFELLVAVVLSAQCTDKRVNMVTPALFQQFPNAEVLAAASVEEVFAMIRSISYPNSKAKHLVALGKMLVEEFKGIVPDNREDLQKLPGVGRKTANVLLSVVYGKATMAVDTHVFRVSKRIGLVPKKLKTPLAVELELMKFLPEAEVPKAHHWLILHGRYVCLARKPLCESCGLREVCNYFKTQQSKIAL
jgi:endonuclease-3